METADILKLHRFNGIETYSIGEGSVSFLAHENLGMSITFQVSETIRMEKLNDTEDTGTKPQAMATAYAEKDLDETTLVGRSFDIPRGYDEVTDQDVAWIYYYSHEELDENVITILQMDGNRIRFRWVATACDVDFYDGSKPRVKFEAESWAAIVRQ